MKKLVFFAAALVAMVACNKSESSISISNPDEIGFFTMAQNETRGYITGNKFFQSTNPDSYNTPNDVFDVYNSTVQRDSAWRNMQVSAYNVTDGADYFIDETFAPDSTGDNAVRRGLTAAIWRHTPTMYWPIGKDLQFLAYSSKNITVDSIGRAAFRTEPKAKWDGAKKVSFDVTPYQCYQNDIVYAEASGSNRGTQPTDGSDHAHGLNIKFYHSQAWLTFIITVVGEDTSYANKPDSARIKVDKIVLEDVYNSGVLSFEYKDNADKKPEAKWDFFTQNPSNVVVDDAWNVLGRGQNGFLYQKRYIKGSGSDKAYNGLQLNMLMPPQAHNDFVLYYTMNEKQNSIKLPFTGKFDDKTIRDYENTAGNGGTGTGEEGVWKMGFHYIYNITIEVNELTFAPTVDMWTMVKGFNPEVQAL